MTTIIGIALFVAAALSCAAIYCTRKEDSELSNYLKKLDKRIAEQERDNCIVAANAQPMKI